MDKQEKRIQVIAEGNNSANTIFRQSLEKKKKNVKEIVIKEKLTGNLNLAILAENGFSKVESFRVKEDGYLTGITNIPTTIKRLYLSKQLIENIELPDGIEYIAIDHNLLSKEWDLSRYSFLRHVNISYNQLDSLGKHLPESLEELYCTHNDFRHLYLAGCLRLKTLHCKENGDTLKIHDLPDTISDFQFPEKVVYVTSTSEEGKGTKDTRKSASSSLLKDTLSKEYQESIRNYFDMKTQYDKKVHYLRINKKLRGELPPCLGCNRLVGMIFSGKDQKYRAYCGSKEKPCDWKIVIHRGENVAFLPFLQEMKDNLEETKDKIIRQKMDTLFGYISDEKSAELFKKYIGYFETNGELLEKYKAHYDHLYFDETKKEIILLKQKRIQEKRMEMREYLAEENVTEAVRIQVEEIQPIAKYIQSQIYADMFVITRRMPNNPEKIRDYTLYQSEIEPHHIEINIGSNVNT